MVLDARHDRARQDAGLLGQAPGAIHERRQPARRRGDVVVDEHEQVGGGLRDRGVARRVESPRGLVRDVAGAVALGRLARRRRRAVVDDEHLGAQLRCLRHDRRERDIEVLRTVPRRDDDGGGQRHRRFTVPWPGPVILLLHNRYRTLGGEERVVDELLKLLPDELGEDVELLQRDSAALSRGSAAAGLLRGGLDPGEITAAVRRTGARVVHAHNVNPTLGWRSLAAARAAGARTVLHLHQYRLVCAVGTCLDPAGQDCTRCHGRDTRPGVRLRCRGSLAEGAVYGAALPLWSRRLVEQADALVTPSSFTVDRLRAMGAPLDGREVTVIANPVPAATVRAQPAAGAYAIVSARLAPDKGVDLAIEACALAGLPLVVTGPRPRRARAAGARDPSGRRRAVRRSRSGGRAGRAARRGRAGDRAVAVRGDLRALGSRGDGGRPAGRRACASER